MARIFFGRLRSYSKVLFLSALLLGGGSTPSGYAWENHKEITRLSLSGWDQWEDPIIEPLENVLPFLESEGNRFSDRSRFNSYLQINTSKAFWDEPPPLPQGADSQALTILAWSSEIPSAGMDHDLALSADQEFLGGQQGPLSYLYRHMYLLAFDWRQPLLTFHYPHSKEVVGQGADRAQLFFNFAVQAKKAKHWYWAYRFLGLALHYFEDINEPYYCQQFGSVALLPWGLLIRGKTAFLKESFRVVTNYRVAYEHYGSFLLKKSIPGIGGSNSGPRDLDDVFRVPRATAIFKQNLETQTELSVVAAGALAARAAAMLAPSAVGAQMGLMAKDFEDHKIDLQTGFTDAAGKPKLDFEKYESSRVKEHMRHRELLYDSLAETYSNTGVAARWLFDRFRNAP